MTIYVQINDNNLMSNTVSLALGFCMWKIWPGKLWYHFFVARQQATSLSNNILDMLLHAQQVMPSNDYICHVLIVQTLVL